LAAVIFLSVGCAPTYVFSTTPPDGPPTDEELEWEIIHALPTYHWAFWNDDRGVELTDLRIVYWLNGWMQQWDADAVAGGGTRPIPPRVLVRWTTPDHVWHSQVVAIEHVPDPKNFAGYIWLKYSSGRWVAVPSTWAEFRDRQMHGKSGPP
jgi:hypothetical protein